jgi:hypothetical protein
VIDLPEWVPSGPWNAFIEMRKDEKHPLKSAKAISLAISALEKLRDAGNDPAAVLNQSTMRSWRGLFEVKNGGRSNENSKHESVLDTVQRTRAKAAADRMGGGPAPGDAGKATKPETGADLGADSGELDF